MCTSYCYVCEGKLIFVATLRRTTTDSALSKTELVYDPSYTIFLLYPRNSLCLKKKPKYDLSKL